jgi:hypothetical protein
MSEGGQYTPVIQVSSTAASSGQPSYVGAEHLTGVLNLRELNDYGYGNLQHTIVGTKGYALYEYQGPATSLVNIVPPFTYSYGGGWKNIAYLGRQYRLDNTLTVASGMVAETVGTLLFGTGDTNYHYLTVVSPVQFDNSRKFTIALVSTNGTSAQYSINESPGLSHVFQFLFKGDVTLRVDGTGGSGAIVQSVFFDDARVTYSPPTSQLPTASTTALTTSTGSILAGSLVTYTATVVGNGSVPTGTVTFYDGSSSLGTAALNGAGVASLSTSALTTGSHAITAVYGGNSAFGSSTSSMLTQLIVAASTTTTLSSSANPVVTGSAVTLTAAVSGNGAVPTGTVTFYDGTSSLGTAALNGAGLASLTTSALTAGSHALTAAYVGNSAFGSSTSSALTQLLTNAVAPPTTGDITNGLVADYPLAANGNDLAGGNQLTLLGSPTFSANAVNWNGAVPTLGYSSPRQWPQNGLTVSAWINLSDPTSNYSVAGCYGNASGSVGAAYLQFYTYQGKLGARIIQSTDVNYIGRYTSALLTTGWHHVALTWTSGKTAGAVKLYLDGAAVDNVDNSAGTFTAPYAGNNVPLILGAQGSVGSGIYAKFTGSQKNVRLYNRALTPAEVTLLYGLTAVNSQTLPPPSNFRMLGQ